MAGAGAGSASIAPEEAAALAQLIGGGMVPGGAPMDPGMTALPPGVGPGPGMPMPGGPIPGMPSTDPAMIAQLRAADHAALDAAQDAAMQQAAMLPGAAYAGAAPPVDPTSLGAGAGPMLPGSPMPLEPLPLPGSAPSAFGGPDYGSMESEDLAPLPGADYVGA